MKIQILFSTCALVIGLSGAPLAMAEAFNDEGVNWTMASPTSSSTAPVPSLALPPAGSFASSWGSGKTPTQYEGGASSGASAGIVARCLAEPPKVSFNKEYTSPYC